MLDYATSGFPQPCSSSDPPVHSENGVTEKRKRKPAGTPDPDAEVVSLSPKTLLESDRYVCEICNQGFQRDQNLQMHRRKHKVAWKLLKRQSSGQEVKKRVFVCPEPSCLHHDPSHALGDLVGIKKHFRRKHSNKKQWVCDKCGKGYAVQSDFKAHRKTCGTRGHSCDCGRVFSRVESFIEHQDACTVRRVRLQAQAAAYSSRALSSTSPSSDINFSIYPTTAPPLLGLPIPITRQPVFLYSHASMANSDHRHHHFDLQHDLELRLLPPASTHSKLSIGSDEGLERTGSNKLSNATGAAFEAFKELAMAERFRQQAQVLNYEAMKKMNGIIMEISSQACKNQVQTSTAVVPADETSLAMSYISSATTEGEGE